MLAYYDDASSTWNYVLTDLQGSTRAVMNNNGSSSAVIARHDFLPFGEEINSGIGLRTSGQGYGGTDYNRQKYGLTQRDDVTGLDHTWWRKLESLSGRWTSPDPYRGSMKINNSQSFNGYSYTLNDPISFIDPTGLECWALYYVVTVTQNGKITSKTETLLSVWCDSNQTSPPSPLRLFSNEFQHSGTQIQVQAKKATTDQMMKFGQDWDKYQKWIDCARPIWARYKPKLDSIQRVFGSQSSRDISAGFGIAAALLADPNPVGFLGYNGAAYIFWNTLRTDRGDINQVVSDYQQEVTQKCGSQPPHP